MKTENSDLNFESDLEKKLSDKKFQNVLEVLKSPENKDIVTVNIWNIITTVCLTLKSKNLIENESDFELCQKILLYLADKGSPKEVIVALMEEADSFKSHSYFCLLLDPLKETLKKVPGKRGKSLEWVLSTLNAHIHTLSLPEDLDLQGEEMLFMDTDPAVADANYVLTHYFDFIDFFVKEVSFESISKKPGVYLDRIEHQRNTLQKYILILFHHPFLYQDLHVESVNRPKSTIRTLCENYIKSLSKICSDVFTLFNHNNRTKFDNDDADVIPPLAFSNLAYLIFVENLTADFQPFVYSHKHIFIIMLKYITLLLSEKENLVLFKGLHMADKLLERLDDFDIEYGYMELSPFTEFPKLLLNIGIFSQYEVHRKMAVRLFLSYTNKCDWKARYHLICQVLITANHSGAEGLVINLYKTYLHSCLCSSTTDSYFLGSNLTHFLKQVFTLKDGVETDIIENSDRITTSLNFLRYLVLKDSKEVNQTGLWDLIPVVKTQYLDPLSKGLDLSRAHYKQAAKESECENKSQSKSIDSTVTVNSKMLPNVSSQFQADLYEKALLTFDVIESLLCRVRELL